MATRKTPAKKKTSPKKKKVALVEIGATLKRGGVTDEYQLDVIPADLAKALKDHAARRLDDAAACRVATKYLAANFLPGNLDDESFFATDDEVWAHEVEAYGLTTSEKGRLPKITVAANFRLPRGTGLPRTQDELSEWEDDNSPLTDAINFFWKFGDTLLLIGDHEGAGAGFNDEEE